MHFANVIEESKSVIGKQFKFPNELIDILTSYALPMNAYHQVMAFLDTFKNKKATQWSQIKEIAFKKLIGNVQNTNAMSIGVDFEKKDEEKSKIWTQIYVEPTRTKDGAFRLGPQYDRQRKASLSDGQAWKLMIVCGIAVASAVVVYKQHTKIAK